MPFKRRLLILLLCGPAVVLAAIALFYSYVMGDVPPRWVTHCQLPANTMNVYGIFRFTRGSAGSAGGRAE